MRTEAETFDLIRAIVAMGVNLEEFLDGALAVDMNVINNELAVGEDVPENAVIANALLALQRTMGAGWAQFLVLVRQSWAVGGRLAGAPDITNPELALDYLQKYLIDGGKNIATRGVTSGAPSFSGDGNGLLSMSATDLNGTPIDVAHPGDLQFVCSRDVGDGAFPGREEFTVIGAPAPVYPWQEGGAATGRAYDYAYGRTSVDFSSFQARANTGGIVRSHGGSTSAGNLLQNGDFERGITGTSVLKVPGWTIDGDPADVEVSPDLLNGATSLLLKGNLKLDQLIPSARLRPRTAYGIALKAMMVNDTGTPAGTLTVKIMDRDEVVTHGVVTVTIGALTEDAPTVIDPVIFFIPADANDLKCQIEVVGLTDCEVVIDDVTVGPATLVDGRLVFIYDGTTVDGAGNTVGRFKNGDTFTISTTVARDTGLIQQYWVNRAAGRYIEHDTAASSNLQDPVRAPIIGFVAPGDLGNTSGPQNVNVTFTNTGNIAAAIGIPTEGATTNASLTNPGTSSPVLLAPNKSVTLTFEVTPASNGAYSCTVNVQHQAGTESVLITGTDV